MVSLYLTLFEQYGTNSKFFNHFKPLYFLMNLPVPDGFSSHVFLYLVNINMRNIQRINFLLNVVFC